MFNLTQSVSIASNRNANGVTLVYNEYGGVIAIYPGFAVIADLPSNIRATAAYATYVPEAD